MISLYDHQADMIDRVRQSIRNNQRVLLQAPTGSGKSVMASAMIAGSRAKDKRSLFVVPRVELLKQMSNTFRAFDIPHGYLAQGHSFNKFARTHIASLATLANRLDVMETPDVVFIDETHWGGDTVDAVIKHFTAKGCRIVGLSATPARQDNFGMGDWYDDMVQGPSIRWLIDNKYLSEYALVQPTVKLGKGQIGGNPVEEWLTHAGGRLTIGYCRDKLHGQKMAKMFSDAGIPSAFIESNTPADERRAVISDFADDKIKIIFNVYLMQMGFDLAAQVGRSVNVRCILDIQPCGSLTSQMQKNGRALRYDADGHAVIIDLAGNSYTENHGYPCADRNWTLDKTDQHKRDVEFREANITLITCKKCFKPARIGPMHCPYCGEQYIADGKTVKVVDGKLIYITPEMIRAQKEAAILDKNREKAAKILEREKRIEKNKALPYEKKIEAREKVISGMINSGKPYHAAVKYADSIGL